MAAVEIGKPYVPGRTSIEPRVEYSFRLRQHELLLCFSQLSEDEIDAVRQERAEFGLLIDGLVIFLLHRFGEAIVWSDAPYSWHRVPPEQQLTVRIVGHSQRKRGATDRPDLRSNDTSPRPYLAWCPDSTT